MGSTKKCGICGGAVTTRYEPMDKWEVSGPLCGKCYSKKIFEHYPGEHVRINAD